ncbi:patched domain-containing protein isoform X2 [Megalopta genalis]|uniref:patched domain-containing protein isoform X2 n=1 Tax=Megalopta genalis TaxID=115081 RepID=UPI0014433C3D|nr:uncharacterized protein LOC117226936 isoform X2 [Megalopta genalis]
MWKNLTCVDEFLNRAFHKLGLVVGHHPGYFVVIPVLLAFICFTGYQRIHYEIDPEYLFSPTNGPSKMERAIVEQYFKVNYSHRFNLGRITRPGRCEQSAEDRGVRRAPATGQHHQNRPGELRGRSFHLRTDLRQMAGRMFLQRYSESSLHHGGRGEEGAEPDVPVDAESGHLGLPPVTRLLRWERDKRGSGGGVCTVVAAGVLPHG